MRARAISSRQIRNLSIVLGMTGLLASPLGSAQGAERAITRAALGPPQFTAGCWTLESDDDCGAHQIGPAVTCFDSEGNPGQECILLETIAAETTKCVATESAGSDRCQLAQNPVCAVRIERWCDDGVCKESTSLEPCCPTHALTGKACNSTRAVAE